MTTLVHPNAQPVVYAHQITFPQAVGSVTSSNWKRAFDALVASVDRDLMRGEPTAVEMALELIGFEILNPGIVEKEAAIEAEIAAKPKPAPRAAIKIPKPIKEAKPATRPAKAAKPRVAKPKAVKPKAVKPKAVAKAPTLPSCRCCYSSFKPEQKNIVYCQACRESGAASRHACRTYQKKHADKKAERDREYRAAHRKLPAEKPCERCGRRVEVRTAMHKYCSDCRVIVDREYRRAYDRRRSEVFKAFRNQEALAL